MEASERVRPAITPKAHIEHPKTCAGVALLLGLLLVCTAGLAQTSQQPVLSRGDLIVSGFPGIVAPADPSHEPPSPPQGQPGAAFAPQTPAIDPEGYSLRIFRPAPKSSPHGQIISAALIFGAKASQIGEVFGIALDDAPMPNIYVAASSSFGVHIGVPDPSQAGPFKQVQHGAANADWMPGQFGAELGGGPGSIYKIDGQTGAVSLFATIPDNSGPGLASIAFDAATRQFFVSDLDSGLIYRLDANGRILDSFDHGTMGRPGAGLPAVADDGALMDIQSPRFDSDDPSTWGYTPKARRIGGMAARAGRLYYAVAEGPQIWSVGIDASGGFADDPRIEVDGSDWPSRSAVTDLAFDDRGALYLAQRGDPRGGYDYKVFAEPAVSAVLRLDLQAADTATVALNRKQKLQSYAIGMRPVYLAASGGVTLGYGYDEQGRIETATCGQLVWSSGDALQDLRLPPNPTDYVMHGLQANDRELLRPQNEPPLQSWFVDWSAQEKPFAFTHSPDVAGHVGQVRIWQGCPQTAGAGGKEAAGALQGQGGTQTGTTVSGGGGATGAGAGAGGATGTGGGAGGGIGTGGGGGTGTGGGVGAPKLTISKTLDPSKPCQADTTKTPPTLTCSFIITVTNAGTYSRSTGYFC